MMISESVVKDRLFVGKDDSYSTCVLRMKANLL